MSSTGVLKYGDAAAREVSERFGGAFDTEALLQALGPDKRIDGMVVVAGGRIFQFDVDSTASDGLSPSSGSGKWLIRGEASALVRVRVATAAALPANTRTTNTLTADANGALNDTGIDGKTDLAVGELVLVKNESTGANNGIYVLTGIGAADAKWTMVRAATHAQSDQMRAGVLVVVAEGTANGNVLFMLTTDDAITLNTTALTFSAIATTTTGTSLQTLLASTSNGEGASLVGIEDSGTLFTAANVEAALAEAKALIDANTADAVSASNEFNITLGAFRLSTGAAVGAFVDNTTDGFELYGSEALGIRWNDSGSSRITLAANFVLPSDVDPTANIVFEFDGFRVGSADATMVLTVAVFFHPAGAAADADADAGGSSTAFDGATTVVTTETLTVLAADVPAASVAGTITIVPDAALDGDDFVLTAVRCTYTGAQLS